VFIVAAAIAACSGGDRDNEPQHAHGEGSHKVREFNPAELDTLRQWKGELEVTRDEYWDDRGGVLANSWGEIWYPPGTVTVSHGMYTLKRVDHARRETRALFGRVPEAHLTMICSASLESYREKADGEWWQYARIEDDRITFQPIVVLAKRGLVEIAADHAYYRWAMRRLSDERVPRWLEYGFAALLSAEGRVLHDNLMEFPDDPVVRPIDDVNNALKKNKVKKDVRIAAYNAWMTTDRLAQQHGRRALAEMIVALGSKSSLDDASRRYLGESWDDAVAAALDWQPDWKR
jgi:hypothetical protein